MAGNSSIEEALQGGNVAQEHALEFMLAGRSEFTLHSTKTGQDFRLRIDRSESRNDSNYVYFVNDISSKERVYAGLLFFDSNLGEFQFRQGVKGKMSEKSLLVRSLLFVLNKLERGETVQHLEVYHVGKCGVCGKKLTDPISIATGIGPTCAKKLNIPRMKKRDMKHKDS